MVVAYYQVGSFDDSLHDLIISKIMPHHITCEMAWCLKLSLFVLSFRFDAYYGRWNFGGDRELDEALDSCRHET